MKLRLIIFVALLAVVLSCGTTTNTSTSDYAAFGAPAKIQTSFSGQYPAANNIIWSRYNPNTQAILDWEFAGWPAMDADDYTARFTLDTFNYHAWYDAGGDWIGSAYIIKGMKSLPDAVNSTIKAQFGSYSFDSAVRQFWKNEEAYEIKLKNGDANKLKLLLDENGNILKQKAGY